MLKTSDEWLWSSGVALETDSTLYSKLLPRLKNPFEKHHQSTQFFTKYIYKLKPAAPWLPNFIKKKNYAKYKHIKMIQTVRFENMDTVSSWWKSCAHDMGNFHIWEGVSNDPMKDLGAACCHPDGAVVKEHFINMAWLCSIKVCLLKYSACELYLSPNENIYPILK